MLEDGGYVRMKMFLISLAIAFALTLPKIGMLAGFDVPGGAWLGIPAAGLGYMLVFFHEIGHTVAFWFFGYPSIPAFDFEHGGGVTYPSARSWLILGGLWACAVMYGARLWKEEEYRLLGWLASGVLLHGILLLTGGDEIIVSFAGHAGEVLVAAFCMLRAFMGTTERSHGSTERWLNMVFGCFVLVYDTVFTAALMFSEASRGDYAMQKGGHLMGDLDRVAMSLHIPMPAVAFFLMVFTIGIFAAVIYLGLRHAPYDIDERA